MPGLLNLKTDLKSLKYGQDQPNGGSSNEPYIKVDINSVDATFNRVRLTKFDDGLIRGGAVGAINASVVDTLRIGKFFTNFPKGPLFLVKQVGLQLSNPLLEHKDTLPTNRTGTNKPTKGQGLFKNVGNAVTNGVTSLGAFISNTANQIENKVGPTRIYNLGLNTLTQIPLNAVGGHVVRHGLLPNEDPSKYYEAVVTQNNFQNQHNRLEQYTSVFNLGGFGDISTLNIGTNETVPELTNYMGGPGSVYGIGQTRIGIYTKTNDQAKISLSKNLGESGRKVSYELANDRARNIPSEFAGVSTFSSSIYAPTGSNFTALSQFYYSLDNRVSTEHISEDKTHKRNPDLPTLDANNDLVADGPSSDSSITTIPGQLDLPNLAYTNPAVKTYADIQVQNDARSPLYNLGYNNTLANVTSSNSIAVGYQLPTSNNPIEYKNNYGDVITLKKSWKDGSRENRIGSGRQDEINLTPIFSAGYKFSNDSIGTQNIRDLVKFRIQAVNTDTPEGNGLWMIFRAYLTDLSDNVDAGWNDVKYAGRGDKFYIYDGFTRKMSVTFKIAALSSNEMKFIYQKLNFLMGNLMPDYSDVIMRGPLVRMTIGNYIDNQLAKLDSLSIKVPQDSPWEIAMDKPEGGTKQLILPHIIEVTLSFTPIGSETAGDNLIPKKSETVSHIAQNNIEYASG